jgi:integrase
VFAQVRDHREKFWQYSGNGTIRGFTMPDHLPTLGQQINQMPAGRFITLRKVEPIGALQARKQSSGAINLYWRYTMGAKSERVSIGLYDSSAPPRSRTPTPKGYSIAAAIVSAELLATQHYQHKSEGGRPALIERKREEQLVKQRTEALKKAAALQSERYSLQQLTQDYANHLERLGRNSHRDVRSIFKLHVVERWPEVAALPAAKVGFVQINQMLRWLHDEKKGRTGNKLRSYLHAAYETARVSSQLADIPQHFELYGIEVNPVANTKPVASANRADKHPLSFNEMCAYWFAISKGDNYRAALLQLHLLTGGQRIEQLVRLKTSNIDFEEDVITLFDSKGRTGKAARAHVVPLTQPAKKALLQCKPEGKFALSTDGGTTHVAASNLSKWAQDVVGEMGEDKGIANFQAKRIRSGIETLLSKAGCSQEIRGHLQSHGLGGIQQTHYDGNDFLPEKLAALTVLHDTLKKGTLCFYERPRSRLHD